jgi:hypothetical protein
MIALLYSLCFGALRALDGSDTIPRWAMVCVAALFLTILNTPIYWMFALQALCVASFFWGNYSKDLFQWARDLSPNEPQGHYPAYLIYKLFDNNFTAWAIARHAFGIAPLMFLNLGWWGFACIPVGAMMAFCYKISYQQIGGNEWVRPAEFVAWSILGLVLFAGAYISKP